MNKSRSEERLFSVLSNFNILKIWNTMEFLSRLWYTHLNLLSKRQKEVLKMKRMIALLLAFVLAASLLPALPLRAKAETGGKLIALTFDDGPSGKYTGQLLDGLKERGVKVTFFMLGEMAGYNRRLVKRVYQEGHEIGCHTWNHKNLTKCTPEEILSELQTTFAELDRACGAGTEYLVRPPYGSVNDLVLETIDAPLVHWSLDSEDWSLLDTDLVRDKIISEVYDGCIILCHDIHKTSIPAALEVIDELTEEGYEFVTVSELFRRRGRELTAHKVHYFSRKNGIDYGPIPAPVLRFRGDTDGTNTVTITCEDSEVPLYYTLDGSYPNQQATRYTGPFTVPYGTTVTAVAAYKLNGSRSELTAAVADAIRIVAPRITQDADGAVEITTPTVGCEIYYTLDDTPADDLDYWYTGPEYLFGPCWLRAVAVHDKGISAETRVYLSEYGDVYYDLFGEEWYYEAMDWAHQNGIINGTGAYTMDPSGGLTRGMLVTMLYRFCYEDLGENWEQTSGFADVDRNNYYAAPIEWAYRNGIVNGYSSAWFGPDDQVTRQQMCKIVAAFLNWHGMPLKDGAGSAQAFYDSDMIAPWALESVENMIAEGLILGDGDRVDPEGGANRAQICVLLLRLQEYMDHHREEPEEPEHIHTWKINYTDVTVNVGERFRLSVYCSGKGCDAVADSPWVPGTPGVVSIDGRYITGVKAGKSTWLSTDWEGDTYKCIVRVRSVKKIISELIMPL